MFGTKQNVAGSALTAELPRLQQQQGALAVEGLAAMNRSAGTGSLGSNTASVGMDFNGDGRQDLLWQNSNGAVGVWYNNGTATPDARQVAVAPQGWSAVAVGNFDGNATTDILWQNTSNGQVGVWDFSTDLGVMTPRLLATVAPNSGWEFQGTGDFNQDGITDLYWENESLNTQGTWTFNAAGGFTSQVSQVATNQAPGQTDYYRSIIDGGLEYNDRIRVSNDKLQARVNGQKGGNNTYSNVATLATGETVATLTDFNNDGKTDVVTRNSITGATKVYQSNGINQNGSVITGVKDFTVTGLYDVAPSSGWAIKTFDQSDYKFEVADL